MKLLRLSAENLRDFLQVPHSASTLSRVDMFDVNFSVKFQSRAYPLVLRTFTRWLSSKRSPLHRSFDLQFEPFTAQPVLLSALRYLFRRVLLLGETKRS